MIKLDEIYEVISWHMPVTFLMLLSLFEIYVMFVATRSIYVTSLLLFYGYIFFVGKVLQKVVEYELSEMELLRYGCIDSHWYVQL